MDEILKLSIREANDLLLRRSISSVELIESTLSRIEETEPTVHAYTLVLAEEARMAARQAIMIEYCKKPRLYALVDGRVSLCCGLVLRPCSLFARACCCIPAVLSSWSRRDYEPSHIEESYLLYHR